MSSKEKEIEKKQLMIWACQEIEKHVSAGSFGTLTIAMANGVISNVKSEINKKPPVDVDHELP